MQFPIERPRPDPRRYFGVPRGRPGYTNMICPTENKLMEWEIEPENMLRCVGCGRSISRDEAQGGTAMAGLKHKGDILNDTIINDGLRGLPHEVISITVRVQVGERLMAIRYIEGVGFRWAANHDDVWGIRKAMDELDKDNADQDPDYDAMDVDRDKVAE